MKTSVTIVSTNINKNILENYKDYYIIENDFIYEELLKHKKVLFFNVLNNLKENKVSKLFSFLKENNIEFINFTNNMELCLYTDYLVVYDDKNILIEGNTLDVLKEEKLIRRIGLKLPFMVELSILLKDYNLINEIYLEKERLVDTLWK